MCKIVTHLPLMWLHSHLNPRTPLGPGCIAGYFTTGLQRECNTEHAKHRGGPFRSLAGSSRLRVPAVRAPRRCAGTVVLGGSRLQGSTKNCTHLYFCSLRNHGTHLQEEPDSYQAVSLGQVDSTERSCNRAELELVTCKRGLSSTS